MKSNQTIGILILVAVFAACSPSQQIAKTARQQVLQKAELSTAHVGISLFDPASGKYLYNFQGDKYFVPASNIKIITCYAAMKWLGDSLVGLRYLETDSSLQIFPTGDPSLLHPDFKQHPVLDFLTRSKKKLVYSDTAWKSQPLGFGWAWDDSNSDYMAERAALPMYGNLLEIRVKQWQDRTLYPSLPLDFRADRLQATDGVGTIRRLLGTNTFLVDKANPSQERKFTIPFATFQGRTNERLLQDTLHKEITRGSLWLRQSDQSKAIPIYSQHTDSLLKPMMHRSDNFFAEQTLLMVSNERLGIMSDSRIIDTLLKSDLRDLPQKPRWVDGSGLSRYNLFTPQDFVAILHKIKNEFSWNRITTIFPTGGTGTINGYYKNLEGKIFAKTGTLSGQVAFSGYLVTNKGKTLIFSVLVNNHQTSAVLVRKAIEQFLGSIHDKY